MPHVTPLRPDDPRHVGRYQLAGRMSGTPGTGPAYLAEGSDGRQVTVSLLGSDWTHDSAARDRFAAEASAAERVQPSCAARILDYGLDAGRAYLVREYVAGPSLLELVSAEGEMRGGDLDGLAIGTATGLLSVHQAGLVHGSFGPEHVIMSSSGPTVIEFGITPPYGTATPAADMLAWARTTLFASLARAPASMSDLGALPAQLRQLVTDCLSPDPAERPLARAAVIDLLGGTEPPTGPVAEGARRASRAGAAPPRPAAGQQPGPPGLPGLPGQRDQPRQRYQAGQQGQAGQQSQAGQARQRERSGQRARPAPGAPDQRSPPEHQRPGSRRTAAIVSALAVVLVAGGLVVIHLDQDPGSQHGKPTSALSSPASRPASSGPSSGRSATPGPAVPSALAGTWAGQVTQSGPDDVFDARLVLAAGSAADSITYSGASFSCAGQLTPTSGSGSTLRLSQAIVQGNCANGVVTITATPSGTLEFSFRGRSGPADSGTLTRQ